jgi:L-methionine (R)-S-oxide reductase
MDGPEDELADFGRERSGLSIVRLASCHLATCILLTMSLAEFCCASKNQSERAGARGRTDAGQSDSGQAEEILAQTASREAKASRITEAIRAEGAYRWVGLYDVDFARGLVSNIAWSGPSAPAYPTFPVTQGLTARAIAGKRTINVGDVAKDSAYLTALDSTRAEIIVPVLDTAADRVVGTIDVESESLNAFDSATQAALEQCARLLAGFWTIA